MLPDSITSARRSSIQRAMVASDTGNCTSASGDLDVAADYKRALARWEEELLAEAESSSLQPLEVDTIVRHRASGFFGVVMCANSASDEYFLKDLANGQPIWAGDAGGTLQRFVRKDFVVVTKELLDSRFAIISNLSVDALRRGDFENVLRWADLGLAVDGRALELLKRKADALLRLNHLSLAWDCLSTAKEIAPCDEELQRNLQELERKRASNWKCATGCCGPWGIVCSVQPRKIPTINVRAVDVSGKHILSLDLHISDAISWVRRQVAAAAGLPLQQVGLQFRSQLLVDKCNVTRAGLKDGDIIQVVDL